MSGFTINTVSISGNLTRDPDLRTTQGGTSVCSLRIASNDRFKTQAGDWEDRPNYFSITVWKGLGEWLANNLGKGDQVVVHGRLTWREWEKDGVKRESVEITADSVIPVPRDGGGGGGRQRQRSDVPADTSDFEPRPSGSGFEPTPGTSDFGPPASRPAAPADDDIPF
jgi:single-strand DNA-binding protein